MNWKDLIHQGLQNKSNNVMSYFKNFPSRYYQFDSNNIKYYQDLSVRPAVVDELLGDYSNLESYLIKDGETPETIAFDKFDDPTFHWVIMLANNSLNIYTDWPQTESMLNAAINNKYRTQITLDDSEVQLTDQEIYELVNFEGLPDNGYVSRMSTQKIDLKPHHFEDANGNVYSFDTVLDSDYKDALGRTIILPEVFPVSHWTYEFELNESKRQIYVPVPAVAKKMSKELKALLNV